MDKIMEGLDFVSVYLDDILISSVDEEKHCKHLREEICCFLLGRIPKQSFSRHKKSCGQRHHIATS